MGGQRQSTNRQGYLAPRAGVPECGAGGLEPRGGSRQANSVLQHVHSGRYNHPNSRDPLGRRGHKEVAREVIPHQAL